MSILLQTSLLVEGHSFQLCCNWYNHFWSSSLSCFIPATLIGPGDRVEDEAWPLTSGVFSLVSWQSPQTVVVVIRKPFHLILCFSCQILSISLIAHLIHYTCLQMNFYQTTKPKQKRLPVQYPYSCPVASLLCIVTTGLPSHYFSPLPLKTLQ